MLINIASLQILNDLAVALRGGFYTMVSAIMPQGEGEPKGTTVSCHSTPLVVMPVTDSNLAKLERL